MYRSLVETSSVPLSDREPVCPQHTVGHPSMPCEYEPSHVCSINPTGQSSHNAKFVGVKGKLEHQI